MRSLDISSSFTQGRIKWRKAKDHSRVPNNRTVRIIYFVPQLTLVPHLPVQCLFDIVRSLRFVKSSLARIPPPTSTILYCMMISSTLIFTRYNYFSLYYYFIPDTNERRPRGQVILNVQQLFSVTTKKKKKKKKTSTKSFMDFLKCNWQIWNFVLPLVVC